MLHELPILVIILFAINAVILFSIKLRQNRSSEFTIRLDSKLENLLKSFEQIKNSQDNHAHLLRQDLQTQTKNQHDLLLNQLSSAQQTQITQYQSMQESLNQGLHAVARRVTDTLTLNAETLGKRVDKLTQETDQRLKEISGQVEKRLSEGFEKTTSIFTDVLTRLALIDEAQKKITELSSNVVSLQEILSDKRARGAFGEVQLSSLIHNVIPSSHVRMQHELSNGKRADCMLLLPEPTGNIAIDAKFPLESYRTMTNPLLGDSDRKTAEKQFRIDVKKHLQDIAQKYILPGETSDGAMMFIPAEAIFAEIHAHHPELVEEAHQLRVWLVSPSTMMAILTTARAVIKDAATRKQIHVIQEHLAYLAQDFNRFQERMNQLAKHIDQAHGDIKDVQTSAKKITSRFIKIEKVELDLESKNPITITETP